MVTVLQHHGIKGMHWGVRRYQNPDGTLTSAGRKRYLNPDGSLNAKGYNYSFELRDHINKSKMDNRNQVRNKVNTKLQKTEEYKWYEWSKKNKDLFVDIESKGWTEEQATKKGYVPLEWRGKIESRYNIKKDDIARTFSDQYRGAILKDIGAEDTTKGREWLRELGYYYVDENGRIHM